MKFYTVREVAFELDVTDCSIANLSKFKHGKKLMIPAKIEKHGNWHRSFYSHTQLELIRKFYDNMNDMLYIKEQMKESHLK